MGNSMECSDEQAFVLPIGAGLAILVALGISATALGASRRWSSNLQEIVAHAVQVLAQVKGDAGHSPSGVSSPISALREALKDSCVLVFELPEYQWARARLKLTSNVFAGACLAALATSGGADLLLGVCRVVLIAMMWVHHVSSTAALRGGTQAVGESLRFVSRAPGAQSIANLDSSDPRSELRRKAPEVPSSLNCLTHLTARNVWLMRALYLAANAGFLALLIIFSAHRHPELIEACDSDSPVQAYALFAERAAATTMVAAWVSGVLAYAYVLQCEACVWISPRAERSLANVVQTSNGALPPSCSLELAEALSGSAGDGVSVALLREFLDVFRVAVICDSATGLVLQPPPLSKVFEHEFQKAHAVREMPLLGEAVGEMPQLGQQDLAELHKELRAEFRRSLDASEYRLVEALKATQEALTRKQDSLTKAVGRSDREVTPVSSARRPSWRAALNTQSASGQPTDVSEVQALPRPASRHRLSAEEDVDEQAVPRVKAEGEEQTSLNGSSLPPRGARPRISRSRDVDAPRVSQSMARPRLSTRNNDQSDIAAAVEDQDFEDQSLLRALPRPRPASSEPSGGRRASTRMAHAGKSSEAPSVATRQAELEASLEEQAVSALERVNALNKRMESQNTDGISEPKPRRPSRMPPRRRQSTEIHDGDGGSGAFLPASRLDGTLPEEIGARADTHPEVLGNDDFSSFDLAKNPSSYDLAKNGSVTPVSTVRAAPPPNIPAIPGGQQRSLSASGRGGARAERPSRLSSRTPPESFVSRLGAEDELPEDGTSGVMLTSDLHDNQAWHLNAF